MTTTYDQLLLLLRQYGLSTIRAEVVAGEVERAVAKRERQEAKQLQRDAAFKQWADYASAGATVGPDSPIPDFLSVRLRNALRHENIATLRALANMGAQRLFLVPNVGHRTVEEARCACRYVGLELAD